MKATAVANSNTAFVKYWGKKNEKLKTPMTNNISMTVDSQNTKTTVEFNPKYTEDSVMINGKEAEGKAGEKVIKHLDLIRGLAGIKDKAKIVSENNFPTAVGLASSASGFAALTVAACKAAGLDYNKKQLSIVSRNGSGSSCRSIHGGFVEWITGEDNKTSYAIQLCNENHWDIRDIAVVLTKSERAMSTRDGMRISKERSPFFESWLKSIPNHLENVRKAIKEKNFTLLGSTAEHNAICMHATAMTTPVPAPDYYLIYWEPATIKLMKKVMEWRNGGLECYFTIDTGANMHIFCEPKNSEEVKKRLNDLKNELGIIDVFESKPGGDAKLVDDHFF